MHGPEAWMLRLGIPHYDEFIIVELIWRLVEGGWIKSNLSQAVRIGRTGASWPAQESTDMTYPDTVELRGLTDLHIVSPLYYRPEVPLKARVVAEATTEGICNET